MPKLIKKTVKGIKKVAKSFGKKAVGNAKPMKAMPKSKATPMKKAMTKKAGGATMKKGIANFLGKKKKK